MSIVVKSKLKDTKSRILGKDIRISQGAVLEFDTLLSKDVERIFAYASLHMKQRKRITLNASDIKSGFEDFRMAYLSDALLGMQDRVNNFFVETVKEVKKKNGMQKSLLKKADGKK